MVTRRFLLLAASALLIQGCSESSASPALEKKEGRKIQARKGTYPMGVLVGRPANDLYAFYIGSDGGRLPKTITVDWNERLDRLWEQKVKRSKGNAVVVRASREVRHEYRTLDPGLMRLRDYRQIASADAHRTYNALNWDKVGTMYFSKSGKVNQRKLKLFKAMAKLVDGRELTAYMLTELMPSNDGGFNRDFMSFLLRNAGRRYIESIPAIFDPKTSFGPFQFTEYALYDREGERRGASFLNQALSPNMKIPGSVIMLRGNLHIRAAYLFALDNIARLIKRLNDRQLKTLERIYKRSARDIVQFMGVSHHAPGYAPKAAMRWLDNGGRSSFSVSTAYRFKKYAIKTAANYDALPA
jgi:hypothetical protein